MQYVTRLSLVIAVWFALPVISHADATAFQIGGDGKSRATFVSDAPLETMTGKTKKVTGTLTVDPADITSERGREVIDDGSPIAFTRGGWLFGAIDDGSTLIEYYVWTDPGGRVPAGPASMFAAGSIVDTIEAVEGLANAGTFSCPIQ